MYLPRRGRKLRKIGLNHSFEGLEFDDAAPQPDHGSMSSIVRVQFREDASDLALDSFFADGELRSNFLIAISLGNQTKNPDFCGSESIVAGVFCYLERDFG
jgi:hypothetical protein